MSGRWSIAVITDEAVHNHRARGGIGDALEEAQRLAERYAEQGVQEVQVVLEDAEP